VDSDGKGLEQLFWSSRDKYIERWYNLKIEELKEDNVVIKFNGDYFSPEEIKHIISGDISVGEFKNFQTSQELIDNINFFIESQSNKDELIFSCESQQITASVNLNNFNQWLINSDNSIFVPNSYDNLNSYFSCETTLTTSTSGVANKINYLPSNSSSIRDRAALFPWCDLLKGDSSNVMEEGDITWCWDNDSIIIAEVVFSNFIDKNDYSDPLDRSVVLDIPEKIWREVVSIKKLTKENKVIFEYQITHDFVNSQGFYDLPITKTNNEFDIFGTSIKSRIVNNNLYNGLYVHQKGNTSLDNKTIFNDSWEKNEYDLLFENYKPIHGTICDILNDNYNIPGKDGMFCTTENTSSNTWLWSVPNKRNLNVLNSNLFIQPTDSTTSDVSGDFGSEIYQTSTYLVNSHKISTISKAIMVGNNSNGLFNTGIGKAENNIKVNQRRPLIYDIDQPIESIPDYENLKTSFPWNIIGHDGKIGPTGFCELIDENGDLFIAMGDVNNKNINDIDEKIEYTNNYTIIKINKDKFEECKKLTSFKGTIAEIEHILAYMQISNSSIIDKKGSRFIESINEIINLPNAENIFDLYIKITEERKNNYQNEIIDYISPILGNNTFQNYLLLPNSLITEPKEIINSQPLNLPKYSNCLISIE
jgi:hypothetical protein